MTKKHFELIAVVIKDRKERGNGRGERKEVLEALANDFANRLQAENERFDKERFLKACGF